jgi:hypothetical protein
MKKHFGLALGFCLSLTFLSVSSASSAAPQIIGSKCAKAGSFRTAKNVKYQCKKSAIGLRWVLASSKSTSTTTSTTTTTTTTIAASTTSTSPAKLTCSNGGACGLGDTGPGGGIVIFDAGSSQSWGRYLEVANIRQSGDWDFAVNAVQAYRGGGFSDWRLPTKDELNVMFQEKGRIPLSNASYHWSSTIYEDAKLAGAFPEGLAWLQGFDRGNQLFVSKFTKSFFRPIRAF